MAQLTYAQIINRINNEGATAYQIWQLLNMALASADLPTVDRPQMIYNYSRNGQINGRKGTDRYTLDEVNAFIQKQVDKRSQKVQATMPQTLDEIDAQIAQLQQLRADMAAADKESEDETVQA